MNKTQDKATTQSKNGQKTTRGKQTFFQRRHTDGQQAHKKIFSITNHQGNANQNHNEL